jgi:HK97 family phage major capsid protein
VPVPSVVPGVTEKLLSLPLQVAGLFGQFTTDSNTVRYAVEGTATSAATGVAEGATKPESTIALSTVDEPVKKIATSITVSDELLEDAAGAQGFINGQLSRFVTLEEEEQLLRGAGGNDLSGLVGRSGVNTYPRGTVDNNAIALGKVVSNTAGSSFVMPDGIIMHPTNWLATRMLTDSAGQFFGGDPFSGAYGQGGVAGLFGQSLWSLPVALSAAVGAGTAIVGSFRTSAAMARRRGVTVEASNSHDDYFVRNLMSIRAEERLALCVYRSDAFTVVSGLS